MKSPTYEELAIENQYLKQILKITEHTNQKVCELITGVKK